MSKLLLGALLLAFLASVALAYIGARPRKSAHDIDPVDASQYEPLQWGAFLGSLAVASLWGIPIYFATAGRPRIRIGDEAIALTRRGHTVTIRFDEITLASTYASYPVEISVLNRRADSREYRIESPTAVIVLDGWFADSAGDDFVAAWKKAQAAVKRRFGDDEEPPATA